MWCSVHRTAGATEHVYVTCHSSSIASLLVMHVTDNTVLTEQAVAG